MDPRVVKNLTIADFAPVPSPLLLLISKLACFFLSIIARFYCIIFHALKAAYRHLKLTFDVQDS